MRQFFKDYFQYTRNERNGIILLLLLCFLLFLAPQFYPLFISQEAVDFSEWEQLVAQLETGERASKTELDLTKDSLFYFDPNTATALQWEQLGLPKKLARTILNYRSKGGQFFQKEDLKKIYGLPDSLYFRLVPYIQLSSKEKRIADKPIDQVESPAEPFPFNPNIASAEELGRLGLSEKVVRTILKFRAKGGRFYKKESLQKIYGLDASTYQRLAPFIDLQKGGPALVSSEATTATAKQQHVLIDINTSTIDDWQQLYGIGPYYAQRIVKFREALGGFHQIEQVAETYNLPDSTFKLIRPHLQASPVFRKISVNIASIDELKKHPYLNYKQANLIISYRNQHGAFGDAAALLELKGISQEQLQKLLPYLDFEQ